MDSSGNPLLLQLRQLFIHYLFGIAVNLQPASVLAHFPNFPEEDIPAFETLINDKMRTYLLNSTACLESYLSEDAVPAALDKLHKWHLRCQFVSTYLQDHPQFAEDLDLIKEILFDAKPSFPQAQAALQDYKARISKELEDLNSQNEVLEADRADVNEQIYELMKDLLP